MLFETHTPTTQDMVAPHAYLVQPMSVNNNQQGNNGVKPVAFKIRLSYTPPGGAPALAEFTVTGLPNTAN